MVVWCGGGDIGWWSDGIFDLVICVEVGVVDEVKDVGVVGVVEFVVEGGRVVVFVNVGSSEVLGGCVGGGW